MCEIYIGFGKVYVETEEDDMVARLGWREALLARFIPMSSLSLSLLLVSLQTQ